MCSLLVLALPGTVAAEWHFTPMIGLTFRGDTNFWDHELATFNRHRNFGGAVSRLGEGIFGVEGIVMSTPGFFKGDEPFRGTVETSRSIALMGNVVVTTPRLWTEYSLRPFVSGGFGLLHVRSENPSQQLLEPVRADLLGFNVGGGAIGFLSNRTGVRFEMRYHRAVGRPETPEMTTHATPARLGYMTASIGLVIRR